MTMSVDLCNSTETADFTGHLGGVGYNSIMDNTQSDGTDRKGPNHRRTAMKQKTEKTVETEAQKRIREAREQISNRLWTEHNNELMMMAAQRVHATIIPNTQHQTRDMVVKEWHVSTYVGGNGWNNCKCWTRKEALNVAETLRAYHQDRFQADFRVVVEEERTYISVHDARKILGVDERMEYDEMQKRIEAQLALVVCGGV